jgi:hypothetical protein
LLSGRPRLGTAIPSAADDEPDAGVRNRAERAKPWQRNRRSFWPALPLTVLDPLQGRPTCLPHSLAPSLPGIDMHNDALPALPAVVHHSLGREERRILCRQLKSVTSLARSNTATMPLVRAYTRALSGAQSPRKNPYVRKALARSSKGVPAGEPCLVLPDVFHTGTDLARTTVLFSTIETKLLTDTRSLVTLVTVRPDAVAIYGPKSRINIYVRKSR